MSASFGKIIRQVNRGILVDHAIKALHTSTGIAATKADTGNDDEIMITIGGEHFRVQCEVVPKIARTAEILDIAARAVSAPSELLVTSFMSHALAAECRANEVQFIDRVGNAYLHPPHLPGVYIFVSGLKPSEEFDIAKQASISTPAALRLIFALLSEPELLNQPYRVMSEASRVAMGGVSAAIKALEARGFIVNTSTGRAFENKGRLIGEWVAGYTGRLRPKLQSMRFAIPDIKEIMENGDDLDAAAWSGEVAASRVLPYLKPATATIYANLDDTEFVSRLVRKYRLQRDPNGAIELIQPFWDLQRFKGRQNTVPLVMIYADLLLSGDSRNITVSRLILDLLKDHDA